MPQPNVRHAGTGWEWGPNPSRGEIGRRATTDDPEPTKRPPGRKNTRDWCKGKVGREHQPLIVLRLLTPFDLGCKWGPKWYGEDVRWHCLHAEICDACGKILRDHGQLAVIAECPAYPGDPGQRAAAEAEAAESARRMAEWRARRQRIITGPQGYRRKRPA